MATALEIRQIWGDVLLDARQFPDARAVTIGSAPGDRWRFLGVDMGFVPAPVGTALAWLMPGWCEVDRTFAADFVAPADQLPDGLDWTLATVEDGRPVARLARGWPLCATLGDRTLDADGLVAEGLARRDPDGTLVVPMDPGPALAVQAAGQTFELRVAPRPAYIPVRPDVDLPFAGTVLASAALIALVAIAVGGLPGSRGPVTLVGDPSALRTVTLDPAWPPPPVPAQATPDGTGRRPDPSRQPDRPAGRREVARQAGIFSGGVLDHLLSSDLPTALASAIGGLTAAGGVDIGGSGLGPRGPGLTGGGTYEGSGGMDLRLCDGARCDGPPGGGSGKEEGPLGRIGGDPIVIGAMDRTLVDEVVKRHLNQLRYCYQRELAKDHDLQGKVTVKFTISADGTVADAAVATSTLGSPAVEACVQGWFRRMRFHEPKGGGIVVVKYPFVFGHG